MAGSLHSRRAQPRDLIRRTYSNISVGTAVIVSRKQIEACVPPWVPVEMSDGRPTGTDKLGLTLRVPAQVN